MCKHTWLIKLILILILNLRTVTEVHLLSGSPKKPKQQRAALDSSRPMRWLLNGPSDSSVLSDCNHTHSVWNGSLAVIHLSQKCISSRMTVLEGRHTLIAALPLDFSAAWKEISALHEFFSIWPKENILKAIITLPTFSLRTGKRLTMS